MSTHSKFVFYVLEHETKINVYYHSFTRITRNCIRWLSSKSIEKYFSRLISCKMLFPQSMITQRLAWRYPIMQTIIMVVCRLQKRKLKIRLYCLNGACGVMLRAGDERRGFNVRMWNARRIIKYAYQIYHFITTYIKYLCGESPSTWLLGL